MQIMSSLILDPVRRMSVSLKIGLSSLYSVFKCGPASVPLIATDRAALT